LTGKASILNPNSRLLRNPVAKHKEVTSFGTKDSLRNARPRGA